MSASGHRRWYALRTEGRFAVGTRVRVRLDPESGRGQWPAEPVGTVVPGSRIVETATGPGLLRWVEFDEPQLDAEGAGPYEAAEVLEDYLESIPVD